MKSLLTQYDLYHRLYSDKNTNPYRLSYRPDLDTSKRIRQRTDEFTDNRYKANKNDGSTCQK